MQSKNTLQFIYLMLGVVRHASGNFAGVPLEPSWEDLSQGGLGEFHGTQGRARKKAKTTMRPSIARWGPPELFHFSLVLLAFLLALPGIPGAPSRDLL